MAAVGLPETRVGRLFTKFLRLQRFDLASKFCDDLLKVLHTWQLFTDGSRQLSRDPVGRDTNRLRDVLQSVLHDRSVAGFAKQKTYSRHIRFCPEDPIDG